MIEAQHLISLFMELVQIDSETKDERKIADTLLKKFTQLGVHVYEDDCSSITGHGAGNLIATLPAVPGAEHIPPIMFTCHMDTVTPGKNIKPSIGADGWIQSDGSTILGADDKAGIAALLEAIRVIQNNRLYHGKVQFIITVGEESGLVGAKAIQSERIDATFGYALDANGTVGSICTAAPMQAKIIMKIYGKSAHAGVNPEDGISAIQVASKAISCMKLGRIDRETTANIGKFEGGTVTNVICDFVRLEGEVRSIVPQKVEDHIRRMRDALETTCRHFQAKAHFESVIVYSGFCFHADDPVVQLAQRAMKKRSISTNTMVSGGGSDANVFNALGIPTVNLAIGYEHIHTTKERIHSDDLVKITEIVISIIQEVTTTT